MRLRSSRPFMVALLAAALSLALPACGGGGGGGSTPVLPGTLVALAAQGAPAPATGGGNFGAFPAQPLMSAASGLWAAFVAPIALGNTSECLYVAQPDATLVRVFAIGDQLPGGSTETISSFERIFMCPGGLLVALVGLTGSSVDFAIVSATVLGGIVTTSNVMITEEQVLPAPISAGLDDLDGAGVLVADNGTAWFRAEATGSSDLHLISVNATGATVLRHQSPGDALPNGPTLVTLDAFGLDRTGTQYAFVADTSAGEQRIYNSQPGAPAAVELAQVGTVLTGPIVVQDVHASGPLIVYNSGAVVWLLEGDGPGTDHVLLIANGISRTVLARTGDPAPGTGLSGVMGELHLMQQESQASIPAFWTNPVGSTNGRTFTIYGVDSLGQPPALAMFNGYPAPASAGGGFFGTTFPGLNAAAYTEVPRNADILLANVLSTGTSALFWIRVGTGLFTLAVEGSSAPGGDTFGPFSPQAAFTGAIDVALFRASLSLAGSGIFRQG